MQKIPALACYYKNLIWAKRTLRVTLSKKAPKLPGNDFIIQNKLNKLRNGGNNNNNGGLLPPPSAPLFNFSKHHHYHPHFHRLITSYQHHHHSRHLHCLTTSYCHHHLHQLLSKALIVICFTNNDRATYELLDPPIIELADSLINSLITEAENLLTYGSVNDKNKEEKTIEQLKY